MITKFVKNIPLLTVLVLSFILFTINLHKPFVGHHDFNSVFFSQIARNLTRHNILDTKLGLLTGSGPQQKENFNYYTHNVPLHPWILAIAFNILGTGDWQARLVSILFSLGNVVVIFLIGKNLYSTKTGILASLFFSLSAIVIYFASSVFPEPQGIFFSLLTFWLFLLWTQNGSSKIFYTLLITSVLSYLTVWGTFFLCPYLVLYYVLVFKKKDNKKLAIFVSLPFFTFILFLLHKYLLTKELIGQELINSFASRANLAAENSVYGITPIKFIMRELHLTLAYFSKTTILLSVFFLIQIIHNYLKKELAILVLGLWGISYILVFSQAAYIHDYFLIYLSPFIALSSAALIHNTLQNNKVKFVWVLVLLFPLLQFLQVKNFTFALINTDANRDGYALGKILQSKTTQEDKVLITSSQFGAHMGVFANYYADKNISYEDLDLETFQKQQIDKSFDYIVMIEDREIQPELKNYLLSRYPFQKYDKFYLMHSKKE